MGGGRGCGRVLGVTSTIDRCGPTLCSVLRTSSEIPPCLACLQHPTMLHTDATFKTTVLRSSPPPHRSPIRAVVEFMPAPTDDSLAESASVCLPTEPDACDCPFHNIKASQYTQTTTSAQLSVTGLYCMELGGVTDHGLSDQLPPTHVRTTGNGGMRRDVRSWHVTATVCARRMDSFVTTLFRRPRSNLQRRRVRAPRCAPQALAHTVHSEHGHLLHVDEEAQNSGARSLWPLSAEWYAGRRAVWAINTFVIGRGPFLRGASIAPLPQRPTAPNRVQRPPPPSSW